MASRESKTTAQSKFSISPARTASDMETIKVLFTAYVSALGIDLSFQNFSHELDSLPGKYSPPAGELFIARDDLSGQVLGCVALRPLPLESVNDCCEMKRLYVAPDGRGRGVGAALVNAALIAAQALGYKVVKLDTLPSMIAAQKLYSAVGFEVCEAYYDTPLEGTVFMNKVLD